MDYFIGSFVGIALIPILIMLGRIFYDDATVLLPDTYRRLCDLVIVLLLGIMVYDIVTDLAHDDTLFHGFIGGAVGIVLSYAAIRGLVYDIARKAMKTEQQATHQPISKS